MTQIRNVRNLAVLAHVDHGKTSLLDSLLWQSARIETGQPPTDPAAEEGRLKAISLMPKVASAHHRDTRIHLLDAPEHAYFGGEIERALSMCEGVILVVDASEGPVPPTRHPLRVAIRQGLAVIVVVNKIDQPGARPLEVLTEVRSLLSDLGATEAQRAFPALFTNARRGIVRLRPDGPDGTMETLLDVILEHVPAPRGDAEGPLRMRVSHVDYDPFFGRVAIGRVENGTVHAGQTVMHHRFDGEPVEGKVAQVFGYRGTNRSEIEAGLAGEVVAVGGIEAVRLGEMLAVPQAEGPFEPEGVEEPSLSITIGPNDSPMAGQEGDKIAASELRERLWNELLANVALRVDNGEQEGTFVVSGRSDLQLSILLEMMRREGHEMSVSRPEPVRRGAEGGLREACERVIADCPAVFAAVVAQKIEARGGEAADREEYPSGWARLEFRVPARGMIGLRSEFLSDTRGRGILNHRFDGFMAMDAEPPQRDTGVLVADRSGRCTDWAIDHLQPRGTLFVQPGDPVYEGMIVGERNGPGDVPVNIVREPAADSRDPRDFRPVVRVIPSRGLGLSEALEFVRGDERVEITPRAVRMRKASTP